MFSYLDKLSILSDPEDISYLSLQLDVSGYPNVCWVSDVSGSKVLRFVRFDGSEWNFRDSNYTVNDTRSGFKFLLSGSYVYFLYDQLMGIGSGVDLKHVSYDLTSDIEYSSSTIDSGDIDFAMPFYFGSPCFLYRKSGTLYAKHINGTPVFSALTNPPFGAGVAEIRGCYSALHLFLFWSEESGSTVTFKSAMFNMFTELWSSVETIVTVTSTSYSMECTLNTVGNTTTPAPSYIPFHCAISYRGETSLNIIFVEHELSGESFPQLVYFKNYYGETPQFTGSQNVDLSVYGNTGIISVVCEDSFFLRSSDLSLGFVRVSSPGEKLAKSLVRFVPVISSSGLHYVYVTDNVAYGYGPFAYSPSKVNREFLLTNSSTAYLGGDNVGVINGYDVRGVVYDSNWGFPFVWASNSAVIDYVKMCDLNALSFLSELQVPITKSLRCFAFDQQNSRVLYCDSDDVFSSYDLVGEFVSTETTYKTKDLSAPLCISVGDKEVAIADSGNHRVVIIDRETRAFLREVTHIQMRYPYYVTCLLNGDILVKCFTALNTSVVYRFDRNSSLVRSFPSYATYSLDVNGVISSEPESFSSYSSRSRKWATIFEGSNQVVCMDEFDSSYWATALTGHTLYGVVVDDSTGQVFVSARNVSNAPVMVELEGLTGQIVREYSYVDVGRIDILGEDGVGLSVGFTVDDTQYGDVTRMTASFTALDADSEVDALPVLSSQLLDSPDVSYVRPVEEGQHVHSRVNGVDVWHFRHNGLVGEKLSINPNLTFETFFTGDLRKVPVFSWNYNEDVYVDTFFTSDGTFLKKIAVWYEEKDGVHLEEIAKTDEDNTITAVYTFEGRIAVSSGDYLSLFSYDTMNRISYGEFTEDIVVYDYRFDYIWAGSKSRGLIWKIDPKDLSSYTEYEVGSAICNLIWSSHYGTYIIHGNDSLSYFNKDSGVTTTFYDTNEYVIKEAIVLGREIAVALYSYDKIPMRIDYDTDAEFELAIAARRKDRVCILSPPESKYKFSRDMEYDFELSSIGYDGKSLSVLGSDDSNVYIKLFDLETGYQTTFSKETEAVPVKIVALSVGGKQVAVLSDSTFLEWSSGEIVELTVPLTDDEQKAKDAGEESPIISIASNSILVKRSEVGAQTGSSSSSSSSSSASAPIAIECTVQIVVGDTNGGANRWDSGIVTTTKRTMLYGGGNNLEPGQQYFASIRCLTSSGRWTEYETLSFVVPHFVGYVYHNDSSSSSSSNALAFVDSVFELNSGGSLDCGTFTEVGILFTGSDGETGSVVIDAATVVVGSDAGCLVWDVGGSQEYTFAFAGETHVFSIGGNDYPVTWLTDTCLAFVIHSS